MIQEGIVWLRRILAGFAGLAGAAFVWYLLNLHGQIDNIRDYTPMLRVIYVLGGSAVLSLAAMMADIVLAGRSGRTGRAIAILTWIVLAGTVLANAGFAAYIFIPRIPKPGDTPPQLMMVGSADRTGKPYVAVVFHTDEATKNMVAWGEVGGRRQSKRETKPVNRHWILLEGLKPATEYAYSINGGPAKRFKTPPAAPRRLRFAAAGDAHVGNPTSDPAATSRILETITKPANGYDAFFVLGDLAQLGYSDKIWKDALHGLAPYTSSYPVAFLPGNHDTMLGGVDKYREYMTPPPDGSLWKRIDIGNVHFLMLDLEWELAVYTAAEKAWLNRELSTIPKEDWVIVMSHTFFYASGGLEAGWGWYDNKAVIDEVTPLFEKHGVDLVMSGHMHRAEVLRKNGVTYVIAGTFGGELDRSSGYDSPASLWVRSGEHGFADVTIEGDQATVSFRDSRNRALFTTTVRNQ